MDCTRYQNINHATFSGLQDLLNRGAVLRVRDQEIRELRNRVTVLERPRERCLCLPHRGNNIFATIAETFWVLAGRSDAGWLHAYLVRSLEFSDDGQRWRGAYGPRLRNWNGIDQISAVRTMLLNERLTRRAVMGLYDPNRDFLESEDFPCNNWLHWLVRDDQLHLNVAVRSNDVVWGFSGVNAFEWSILQEIMAFWVGVPVGEATYLASSFHMYARHYEMATKLVADFDGTTCYDFGIGPPAFGTPWESFDETMREWFALEHDLRSSADHNTSGVERFPDLLLRGALQILRIYLGAQQGWPAARLREELGSLPETDLTAGAYEYFMRKYPNLREDIPQPRIASYFGSYYGKAVTVAAAAELGTVKTIIKALHRRKDAAYGLSWKRRGELTSVLANIARKVDRIEIYISQETQMGDESHLDTAVDLFVYATKYRLFLMEFAPELAEGILPQTAAQPFSDHVVNFEVLVDQANCRVESETSVGELAHHIITTFEDLHAAASTVESPPQDRFGQATLLADLSMSLICAIAREQPRMLAVLKQSEQTLTRKISGDRVM
jgi:thymidylate synthase